MNRPSTRDMLLDTAGTLLAEIGMERISTNLICERTGVTPPALYYYFTDKFEIVVALGERLMSRQNVILESWIEQYASGGVAYMADHTEVLLRQTVEITEAEPGGIWIERALHSSPRLDHVRRESHRYVTELLTDAVARHLPGQPVERIRLRMRMLVEFGYAATELLHSEGEIPRDTILAEAAHMQKLAALDLLA